MATKKTAKQKHAEHGDHTSTSEGLAGQVPSPNPGDAVLEVGEEVKPTTVSDVVTPDGVLSKGVHLDETIGSF